MLKSRVLYAHVARGAGGHDNGRTLSGGVRDPAIGTTQFRRLFVQNYDLIRAAVLDFDQPGVAVVAIDALSGAVAGVMCLAQRSHGVRAGVLGRHSAADLALPGAGGIALRHLAVLVEPARAPAPGLHPDVRCRILDLRTGAKPIDEEGRRIGSLTVEGPAFLSLHRHAVMVFTTGDSTDWPARAEDAWSCLPERVFVEEQLERFPSFPVGTDPAIDLDARARHRVLLGRTSTIIRLAAPVRAEDDLGHLGERSRGSLTISSHAGLQILEVGSQALRRGILIGRYSRCDASADSGVVRERSVSRVHLLVTEVDGSAYAIDLASSNGTYVLGDVGSAELLGRGPLANGTRLRLGRSTIQVIWQTEG